MKNMNGALDRLQVACEKGTLDPNEAGLSSLHSAARHQYDVCYGLVSDLRKPEEESSHWTMSHTHTAK